METFYIPTESDFRRWIKEAVKECLEDLGRTAATTEQRQEEAFLSRKEIAAMLDISLVTLTDWTKRGLPFHKQRRRVYFVKQEVLEYIRSKKTPVPSN